MEDRRQKYKSRSNNNDKFNGINIDIKLDITELDLLCAYIVSDNRAIRRGNIITLRKVFDLMNMSVYGNSTSHGKKNTNSPPMSAHIQIVLRVQIYIFMGMNKIKDIRGRCSKYCNSSINDVVILLMNQ